MVDIRALYGEVEERLDMDYVREVAHWTANCLRGLEAVGVVLQPGDGTRYDFVFTPAADLSRAPARVVDGQDWGNTIELGVSRVPGTALVSWIQSRGCGAFDFRSGGFEPVYLNEIFETTMGSACTLALLFNAIAEAWNNPPYALIDPNHEED